MASGRGLAGRRPARRGDRRWHRGRDFESTRRDDHQSRQISAGPALLNGTTNIESVIDKVLPAVVSIDATSQSPSSQSLFGGNGARRSRGPG